MTLPDLSSSRGSLLSGIAVALLLTGGGAAAEGIADGARTAFFYAARPPVAELGFFDRVVVEPASVTAAELLALRAAGSEPFAYLSLGEVAQTSPWRREVKPEWVLGQNPAWDSLVMDPSNAGWRAFVLAKMDGLVRAGYRGFFLDTLDSYRMVLSKEPDQRAAAAALTSLISELHHRVPANPRLLFNRGFELFPAAAPFCAGVVAESLFRGWDAARGVYVEVSPADRTWLVGQLNALSTLHHLPVTVIDYVPPTQRELARQTARQIVALGFTPYVTDGALAGLGLGTIEVVPRRVLALYDGVKDLAATDVHRLLTVPLEHLGYAVDAVDVRFGLPSPLLTGRYAGVVAWFANDEVPAGEALRAWLLRQLDGGVRVAFFGHFGFSPDTAFLKRLGLARAEAPRGDLQLRADALIGFEAPAALHRRELPTLRADDPALRVHLAVEGADGQRALVIGSGAWGGVALDPYVMEEGFAGRRRWVLDPFAFLSTALQLPPLPAPEVTTENGRRLLTVEVNGTGFAAPAEVPGDVIAAELLTRDVLQRYKVPTTVSFLEAELALTDPRPGLSARLTQAAQRIAALGHVDLAGRPARWSDAADLVAVLEGSLRFVNEAVAPAGKQARMVLWSRDALPSPAALATLARLGVLNVNGGIGPLHLDAPTVAELSPLLRRPAPIGAQAATEGPLQVYSAFADEASAELGPAYGYRRMIDAFGFTEQPRRLKPIALHFDFGLATGVAGMEALKQVFDWTEQQEAFPVPLAVYARKVVAFDQLQLARRLDGTWELRGLAELRTLRLDRRLGWPDLGASPGVIGVRELTQGRYLALDGRANVTLRLAAAAPAGPYLGAANARVVRWVPDATGISFRLAGHAPVSLVVGGLAPGVLCRVLDAYQRPPGTSFTFTSPDTGDARLVCP